VLGTIYLARSASPENNKAALDSLQHAVALDDSLVGAYYSLGMIYRRLNRLSEAAESLERALKLDPNGKEIRRLLATTYQQMGKADAAQKQFRKVREQMTQERHAQRLNYLLGEAEMRSPQNPAAHFQLGCFYLETNELNKAAAALQNAARLDPRWAEVHDKLALVYQRLGKQEEANKERKTARELRQP
jgi:Tfp pilus assembly protein PilF